MIPVQYAERIKAPVWERPNCRCSDCILNPTSSHGIYIIGAYKVPSVLSRRGNRVTDQAVEYAWPNGGQSGLPFVGARSDETRAWFI